MTNKAKFALGLIAMEQYDLMWHAGELRIYDRQGNVLVAVKIEHTLTRYTDALNKALEAIMDLPQHKNFTIPPE